MNQAGELHFEHAGRIARPRRNGARYETTVWKVKGGPDETLNRHEARRLAESLGKKPVFWI